MERRDASASTTWQRLALLRERTSSPVCHSNVAASPHGSNRPDLLRALGAVRGRVGLDGRGARLVSSVPYVGYLVDFARTPLGWTLLLVLPATYLGFTT